MVFQLLMPMPRKDRAASWSGRPLWMEVADATRVKVSLPTPPPPPSSIYGHLNDLALGCLRFYRQTELLFILN